MPSERKYIIVLPEKKACCNSSPPWRDGVSLQSSYENKYFVVTKCEQFDAESNKYTIEFIDNEAYFIKKIAFIDDKNKYNIGDIIDFTKNEDNFD